MKKCSTFLAINIIQNKTTMRSSNRLFKMAKIKNSDVTDAGEDVEKLTGM